MELLRWEPQGSRFALLTAGMAGAAGPAGTAGAAGTAGGRNVSFYSVYRQKNGEKVNETCLLCGRWQCV